MKKQFQSKSVPRGTRTIWRYLGALILLFSLAIGNVWAATFAPENNPATKKYGDITFLDVANTKANGKITADGATFKGDSTLAYSLRYVGQTLAITTWYNCSDGNPASNFESSPTYADAVINGFVAPSSTSGNVGYGGAKAHSSRIRYFYATGITSVAIISHDNGSSKYVQLKIEEVASNGDLSAVTTIDSPNKSSSNLSLIEYTTALNPSKYYKISCTSNNSSNCKVYQIRFGKYIAPATNYTITYDKNGGSGTMENSTNTVSACTFTAPDATQEFKEWNTASDGTGDSYKAGDTAPSNLDLFAIWQTHTASDNADLSALSVAGCTLNETFDPATTAYTISLPFYGAMPAVGDVTATKDDANAADPAVSISGNVITVNCVAENGTSKKDYTITVSIAAAPAASSSINVEQLVLDNSKKYDIGSALDAAHIGYVDKDALDSLTTAADRNEPYLGLKFKKSTSTITIVVPDGQYLKVKFGARKTTVKVSVNGAAAADAAITDDVYTLAAVTGVRQVVFSVTENNKTIVLKQVKINEEISSVTLPWLVTYDAGEHGTCATTKETWKGTALTLPAVTPESGWDFDGWYDGETKVTSPYNPGKDAALVAHYTAQAAGTDLEALTYQIGAGAATAVGYTTGTHEYTVKLPYAGSYEDITVAVTPVSGASIVDDATKVLTVSTLPGDATFTVTDGVASQLYTVHFVMAPKDGVEIIGAVVTGNETATETGLYKGTASVKLKDKKIDKGDYYIYVTLKEGQTFQDGDVLVVDVNAKSSGIGTEALEISTGEGNLDNGILISLAVDEYSTGENTIVLSSVPDGATSIGLKRSDNLNAKINGLKVYRPMNPVLTAITINGRDGEIDALDDKHFTVTIPNDADLASLTIVPTIYRNAAHATTPEQVMTNSGAWVLTEDGNNTYRIMDKDGDYTDYTITLIRDVLKYTVKFNTQGGSPIEDVEVVANDYLSADQVPAAPEKAENEFQGWAESATGEVVADITTIKITGAKTFYAIWAAEPAGIKLFDGDGNLNTVNFISPAKTTIEINEVSYPCLAAFASNRYENLKEAKQADLVMYSATTDATKIKFDLYNNASSAKTAYLWLVEEGDAAATAIAEVNVPGETRITTSYYSFNGTKNRSFYLTSAAKNDIKVLQAKVIESGDAIHQFGQAGYSLNFNKGRIAVGADATVRFEGASIHSNENYGVLNSTSLKLKTYIQFNNAVANTIVKITKASSNKYYVTNDLENKGDEYSTDKEIVLTTTGTWYIGSVNSGSVAAFSKIEFIAPKCAEPAFNSLANSELCEGDDFAALDGTATVSDAGTPIYQWYNADGDVKIEGATATSAKYTPTADGSYYVIATNQLAGYSDNSKKSETVTVKHFAAAEITTAPLNQRGVVDAVVTLSVAAEGKNLSYEWFTCNNEAGDDPVAVSPAATSTSLDVTITEGMSQWYKVVVTSDCGNVSATAKVEQFVPATPANVTESITWDWTSSAWPASGSVGFFSTDADAPYELLADADAIVPNNEGFRSDMLYGKGQYVWRSGNKFFQGTSIKFTTEVAGIVRVSYRGTGNSEEIHLTINGKDAGTHAGGFVWSNYIEVLANEEVVIVGTNTKGSGYTRIQKIEFVEIGYQRSGLNPANIGTICLPNGGIMKGATLYKMLGKDANHKLNFEDVEGNRLEAGNPYIFVPEAGRTQVNVYYTDNANVSTAGEDHGLVGTFEPLSTIDDGENSPLWGNYIISNNKYILVDSNNCRISANRAYIRNIYDDSEVPYINSNAAPAPGRKRLVIGAGAPQVATGIGDVQGDEVQSSKVLINGQLFILRGEKMYDATGRLVK